MQEKLLSEGVSARVELIEGDIRALSLKPASVIVLNFTLQFIPPEERLRLLRRLRETLVPGGIAQVSHESNILGEVITDLHHAFKKRNGHTALENELQPLTIEENLRNFRGAGFSEIEIYAKSMNFASFILLR